MTAVPLATANATVRGAVEVPGLKSGTNRALVLSVLADGPLTAAGALESRDYDLMVDALRVLGVNIEASDPGELRIMSPQHSRGAPGGVDCGLAGTVMCFVPPLAVPADLPTCFYGDPQATIRPMSGLLDGLRWLGARIDADPSPFILVPGSTTSDSEVVMGSFASSQFVSGLLLIRTRLPSGLRLRHAGDSLPSWPYTAMTMETLRAHGMRTDEPNARSWRAYSGPAPPLDIRVGPDLTDASIFLVAGAVTGGCVTILGWPGSTLQSGARLLGVAERMGCTTTRSGEAVTLSGPGRLRGIDVDLRDALELTPAVAAPAAPTEGTTRITGVACIRGHEADRLPALTTELRKLGVAVIEHHGGLEITGGLWGRRGMELSFYADHHTVHSAAIAALGRSGAGVNGLAYVPKTMPDFPRLWNQLVTT